MSRTDPERTCLVCRRKRPKPELLRVARSPEGRLSVDPGGRLPGRGTYVCRDRERCRSGATRRGALARALSVTLAPDDLLRLANELKKETVEA